ncbi:MAG: hypothetical protein PHE55_05140 [Methylococcaceae bacterium]|nr:hypothetical protein [Methylococcaceae bacterium]
MIKRHLVQGNMLFTDVADPTIAPVNFHAVDGFNGKSSDAGTPLLGPLSKLRKIVLAIVEAPQLVMFRPLKHSGFALFPFKFRMKSCISAAACKSLFSMFPIGAAIAFTCFLWVLFLMGAHGINDFPSMPFVKLSLDHAHALAAAGILAIFVAAILIEFRQRKCLFAMTASFHDLDSIIL